MPIDALPLPDAPACRLQETSRSVEDGVLTTNYSAADGRHYLTRSEGIGVRWYQLAHIDVSIDEFGPQRA